MAFCRRLIPRAMLALYLAAAGLSLAGRVALAQPAPASPAAAPSAPSKNAETQSAYKLPPEKLARAVALSRIRNVMDIVSSLWAIAVLWLLLATRTVARLQAWAEIRSARRWLQGIWFFAALIAILMAANLPLDLLSHIVSRNYGISVQSWAGWFGDEAKSLALAVAIGAPLLLLFNWVVRRWPRRYWLIAWGIAVPLVALGLFASPFFEPFFNTFEPLSKDHADLVAQLERVVERTGTDIPPERMFLMKASEKTNGLNAYVSGLGATKRIVVWDTTAGRIPNDEILFVFGHESGHYVLNHIPKMFAGVSISLFFIFWACAAWSGRLARRYGARWQLDKDGLGGRAGFVVLIFAVTAAGFVIEPIANNFSRHFEHEADIYGQEAIHGLVPDAQKTAVAGFNALGEAWLEDPDPSPLVEFWLYDHPSVKTRANFAAQYDPWTNGGKGQFFAK